MLRRNVSKFSHKINVRRKEVDYTRIFDILKYYYSSQLRVCMCGNSLANVLFSLVYLYLTYILHTYATSFLGKRDWVRECTAAMYV